MLYVPTQSTPRLTALSQTATLPDTIVLSEKPALGKVSFSHSSHTTKNYNIEGTRPVYCVECHHVEQPEAEAKKIARIKLHSLQIGRRR